MSEREKGGRRSGDADEPRERERDRQSAASDHSRNRQALLTAAIYIGIPLAIVTLIPSLVGLYLIDKEVTDRVKDRQEVTLALCQATTVNRNAIRSFLASPANDPTLLKPGQYGYAYAQANPEEAKLRSEQLRSGKIEAFRFFPIITCNPDDPNSPLNPDAPNPLLPPESLTPPVSPTGPPPTTTTTAPSG
jgi:hypothetical protein